MTNLRNEALQAALEERYTNVTFVKDIDENRKLWTVGNENKELVIFKTWKPEELLTTFDLQELSKQVPCNRSGLIKFNAFKQLALQGKTEISVSAYKKLTIKKIEALLEA